MGYIIRLFKSKLFLQLFSIKVLGTIFGMFVYGKLVGGLGDSGRYLSADLNLSFEGLTNRTLLTDNIFAILTTIFPKVIASLIPSVFLGYVIWWIFRPIYYSFVNKLLFWSCILLPQFIIWSSAAGKEVIAITAFLVVIKSTVDLAIKPKSEVKIHYLGLSLLFAFLMRPHYFIPYLLLFLSVFLISKIKSFNRINFTGGVALVTLVAIGFILGLVLIITYEQWYSFLNSVMATSKSYFLSFDAGSNRLEIQWSSVSDFFANMWWGLPTSIIGPTPVEALQRPLFIPVFIEGLFSLLLIFYLVFKLLGVVANYPQYKAMVVYGLIPALIMALVIHYPFGIFNPGSALRYKQALAPLFYFYPILFMAELRKVKTTNKGKKISFLSSQPKVSFQKKIT